MISIQRVAALCESIYYNGRVKSESKLDFMDFLEHARYAHGAIVRKLYYELKNAGEDIVAYFAQAVVSNEYDVPEKDGKARAFVAIDTMLRLPRGLGVLSVDAAPGTNCDAHFHPVPAGTEWLYEGPEYEDVKSFAIKSGGIMLYNSPECMKKVEVAMLKSDEDVNIPEDIAFDIVNAVLGIALKVAGFPVDKTMDGNPNVTTIKQRLSQPESI